MAERSSSPVEERESSLLEREDTKGPVFPPAVTYTHIKHTKKHTWLKYLMNHLEMIIVGLSLARICK